MHLGDWLAQQPRGAKQRLARLTGLAPSTITDIARRKRAPKRETAQLIEEATKGAVTVQDLTSMPFGVWLARQPRGTRERLSDLTGLWPNTITKLARGKPTLSYEKAQLIVAATGGAVSAESLLPTAPFGIWLARQPIGTRQRLAAITGLWPNTITDIASGKRIPEYDTAQLIATATDGAVTVDEIMQSSVLSKATDKRAQRRRLRAQRIESSDRPNDDARD